MTARITYPSIGRGAWSYKKPTGGTLTSDGKNLGSFYVLAAPGVRKVGVNGYRADKWGWFTNINNIAVWRAVQAIQVQLKVPATGIFDVTTSDALKGWQTAHGLTPDGVFGRVSAKAMFAPVAKAKAKALDDRPELLQLVLGHIGFESMWDPGAVGGTTPQDLGLGQINGPAHPLLTEQQRLDPLFAIGWIASFVESNLVAMNYVVRDAAAAYNLGQGGAREWIRAGRPDIWTRTVGGVTVSTNVKKYIDSVLAAV